MTDKQMIDEKALKRIIQLTSIRDNLEKGFEITICTSDMTGIEMGIYNTEISVKTKAFNDFFKEQISDVDKELISLGFQPSPLDLKEGESK